MTHSVDPIMLSIPERLETERLLIRAPLWGDGAAMNEAILESLEELRPWMPFARTAPTLEDSEKHIRLARVEFLKHSELHMLIFNKHTGELIGSSGLHRIDWDIRSFETGYWIRTSCAGNGYITEAVNGIADFAIRELEANRIEIRCNAKNVKSAAVAERAGFTLEGIYRNNRRGENGELENTKVFAKVRGIEYE
ncbi:GNAT family N-acetyltransferase [Paenibacillus sp. 7124]|uniref:GNAT family N-acetyltransferase n=1 Tax=Paenibacillus apii TaxID=1850370 RepID=A0A6M1PJ87_9BACL|nr:GNAT family N-acetyltransferase [Paenibacillus apii]NGM82614.1 GNAT family N-acetyltransferase [Paenibacillus apii]